MQLILLRHGESIWNLENRFTGWTDVALSDTGITEARQAGETLRANGFDFDLCYTSTLKRAINTLNYVLEALDREWLPVVKSWKLNERHYGALQGLNKAETAAQYGEAQVKIWRRSFDVPPPALAETDERSPKLDPTYRDVDPSLLPLAESLKDTIARTVPYFQQTIQPQLQQGKRVLIAAHGNSLRALVMHLDHATADEIMDTNIPTGIPLYYEFDGQFNVTQKRYLADDAALQAKMQAVANQGKAL